MMTIRTLVTSKQAKTARKILGWSNMRVARVLQIARSTLERAETSRADGYMSDLLSSRLRKMYEAEGIVFFQDSDGPGARLDDNAKATSVAGP